MLFLFSSTSFAIDLNCKGFGYGRFSGPHGERTDATLPINIDYTKQIINYVGEFLPITDISPGAIHAGYPSSKKIDLNRKTGELWVYYADTLQSEFIGTCEVVTTKF